jgi:hypothetical protein
MDQSARYLETLKHYFAFNNTCKNIFSYFESAQTEYPLEYLSQEGQYLRFGLGFGSYTIHTYLKNPALEHLNIEHIVKDLKAGENITVVLQRDPSNYNHVTFLLCPREKLSVLFETLPL